MRSSRLRSVLLALAVVALVAGCSDDSDSGDDGGDAAGATTEATDDTASGEPDQSPFCAAAEDFAVAQEGAADESTPEGVEARLTAITDAADALVETAPDDLTEDVQAFADAMGGLQAYGAERDYEIDLGSASPEYQSGEGQAVIAEITDTVGVVDQAVQDECDRYLNEAP